jgi:hypothetical protein
VMYIWREGGGNLYDLGWVKTMNMLLSFLLVPALVFGGFDFSLLGNSGRVRSLAQFVYFYEGVLAEKRLYKEGVAIADGQVCCSFEI